RRTEGAGGGIRQRARLRADRSDAERRDRLRLGPLPREPASGPLGGRGEELRLVRDRPREPRRRRERRVSSRPMGRRQRRRDKAPREPVSTTDYTDDEGNV